MRVVSVTLFDPILKSAEVIISDGKFTCRAFSHPCHIEPGAELIRPLQLLDEAGLMLTDITEPKIEAITASGLAHRGVALVMDAEQQLFAVGGLHLQIAGSLPGGISSGDMIEFECARIDIY